MAKFRSLKRPSSHATTTTTSKAREQWNRPPSKASTARVSVESDPDAVRSTVSSDPMPRAFQRILNHINASTAKTRNGDEGLGVRDGSGVEKKRTRKKDDPSSGLTRRKGESMRDFYNRVDNEARKSVNAAALKETKTASKRKQKLKERKDKLKEKRRKGKKGNAGGDEDGDDGSPRDGRDTLFGTQASEPPSFTVVPKKIGGGAGAQRALAKFAAQKAVAADGGGGGSGGSGDDAVEEPAEKKEAGPGRKTKLRNLSMSQRKIIDAERTKAIEHYRSVVKSKQAMRDSEK